MLASSICFSLAYLLHSVWQTLGVAGLFEELKNFYLFIQINIWALLLATHKLNGLYRFANVPESQKASEGGKHIDEIHRVPETGRSPPTSSSCPAHRPALPSSSDFARRRWVGTWASISSGFHKWFNILFYLRQYCLGRKEMGERT